jgi:hypothetical protein
MVMMVVVVVVRRRRRRRRRTWVHAWIRPIDDQLG